MSVAVQLSLSICEQIQGPEKVFEIGHCKEFENNLKYLNKA